MPLTTPILGGGDSPSSDVVYSSRSSIDLRSFARFEGDGSISVLSTRDDYRSLSSIVPKKETFRAVPSSIGVDLYFAMLTSGSLEIVLGDNFMILADILAENLSGPNLGSFGYYEINAELKVNGTVVPIKSFNYNVPTGKLGSILNVALAIPTVTQVPAGAAIIFSLVVKVGGVSSTYKLIDNGKLQERSYIITYRGGKQDGPQDEVSFSSLDVISDKFGLAPRRPITMYDPSRVRMDSVQTRNDQMTRDEYGGRIMPVIEPVYGLNLRTILSRAYTGIGGSSFITPLGGWTNIPSWVPLIGAVNQLGCGFDAVITNIPDYRVRRADFTIEGGWHDGAQPAVAMYGPVYFVHNNTLFIMDPDRALPAGMDAHTILLAEHKSLTERIEYKVDANAVMLTYQYTGNDPSEDPQKVYRDVYHDEVIDEIGTSGEAGYSKVTTRRWDREYYMTDTPDEVLDTQPVSSDTETTITCVWYDDAGSVVAAYDRVTHQETIDYLYEGDLKIKHTRVVKAAVPDPGAGYLVSLLPVEEETCDISWVNDPLNPGLKLQDSVRTDIKGICVWGPDDETVIDGATTTFRRPIPVLQAYEAGIVTDGWIMGASMIPIKSIRTTLQNMKGQHFDVEMIETDYLNNTHKRSSVEPTTGTVSNDPFATKSRSILLRDRTSELDIGYRIPVPVNAYELPRLLAIQLGYRVLSRLKNPLMALPIALAGVDFTIARGSVIQGQKRTGYTTNYFVTGYTITGTSLGKHGHRISQNLEATELLTV